MLLCNCPREKGKKMIAILEPRCYEGDTRKFGFNMKDDNQLDNFVSWIEGLNDNGHHDYIVYWITPEEYENDLKKGCI